MAYKSRQRTRTNARRISVAEFQPPCDTYRAVDDENSDISDELVLPASSQSYKYTSPASKSEWDQRIVGSTRRMDRSNTGARSCLVSCYLVAVLCIFHGWDIGEKEIDLTGVSYILCVILKRHGALKYACPFRYFEDEKSRALGRKQMDIKG